MNLTIEDARRIVLDALGDVAPEIDAAIVRGTSSLTELDLDSMDQLALLAALEERTGRSIPDGIVRPDWGIDALAGYLAAG